MAALDGLSQLKEVLGTLGIEMPSKAPPDLGSAERTHVYVVGDVVVKCDARFESLAMVREVNALTLLGESALPVPVVVASGAFDDGRRWVATERMAGHVPGDAARLAHELSPGLARQLGTLVAALHRAVSPPGFGTWTDKPESPRSLKEEARARWQALAKMGFERDPLVVSRSELEALVQLGEQTLDSLDGWRQPVLAHRDIQPRNLLVDGDRITALLDFESSAGGDPAEDFNVVALGWTSPGYAAFCQGYRAAGGHLGEDASDRLTHYVLRWVLAIYAYLGRIAPAYIEPARTAFELIVSGERPGTP